MTEGFGFSAVPWLPPFRLSPALLDGALEVIHPPEALRPFSLLHFRGGAFLPDPSVPAEPGDAAALRAALAGLPPGHAAAPRRWALGTALAAAEAGAALRALGSARGWVEAAAERRRGFLLALDAGTPPPAASLLADCHAVPHAFRHLGKALPTAEAVRLLAPLGRICEPGAGFGLFARALERAGMAVAASDPDSSANAGVAFPVRKGADAAETLTWFAARGPLPPLLLLWPQIDEGDWFAAVFDAVEPGGLVAMASPEVEFCAAGGLSLAEQPGPGWRAAAALRTRLAQEFEEIGQAPVVPAGWPLGAVPLRLWRRR